jgi:hypothetical protein
MANYVLKPGRGGNPGYPASEAVGNHEVFRANVETTRPGSTRPPGQVVNKPIAILRGDGKEIPISVSTALLKDESGAIIGGVETFRDLSLVESLRKEIDRQYRFGDIVSKSPAMQKLFAILPEVAQSESTVLLQGESGTGKELFSRAIHALSPLQALRKTPERPDTLLDRSCSATAGLTDAKRDVRVIARRGRHAAPDKSHLPSPRFALRVLEERTTSLWGRLKR